MPSRIRLEPVDQIPRGGKGGSMWTPILQRFVDGDNNNAKLAGVDKAAAQNIRYAACSSNFCVKVLVRDGEIYLSKEV